MHANNVDRNTSMQSVMSANEAMKWTLHGGLRASQLEVVLSGHEMTLNALKGPWAATADHI